MSTISLPPLEPANATDRERFQHKNTIHPELLRRTASEHLIDAMEQRLCEDVRQANLCFIVDGKPKSLIFSPDEPFKEREGKIEVTFRKDSGRDGAETFYFADYHLWSGGCGRSSHRHVLVVNGVFVRPWSEWHKFRSGPHREGDTVSVSLVFDPTISPLLKWEREALDSIEKIDRSLRKYRLVLREHAVEVRTVKPHPDDSDHCQIVTDRIGGIATVILPEWLSFAHFVISPLNKRDPRLDVEGGDKRLKIPLTPRMLKKHFPIGKMLTIRLEDHKWWVSFH